MASSQAFQDEINAYKRLNTMLKSVGSPFQEPAGADAGFPDFGFTVETGGKTYDLHIEYKNAHTAQMGSMRDWLFSGTKFYTKDMQSEQKQELISLMNNTPIAITNGKRLLKDLKNHFSPDVKEIYSGSLTVVKDRMQRRVLTQNFADNTRDYQIANIASPDLGNKIISHYKNKFKKSMNRSRAQGHVLMMMIKDELWWVDKTTNVSVKELEFISQLFGVKKINKLQGLTAQLEVRIQPRGLTSPTKPTSIDVMASYRLKGKPHSGVKVI
jgi:hypothetical protein